MLQSPHITWDAPDGDNAARRVSQLSYDAVGRKAKNEWLALFAEDAVVEDPAGPSFFDTDGKGHRGRDEISAFWDTVIASARSIHFTVHDSVANGPFCANVATFTTELADGTVVDTDLVATYRVNDEGLIEGMRAHWEMDRAMATARRP